MTVNSLARVCIVFALSVLPNLAVAGPVLSTETTEITLRSNRATAHIVALKWANPAIERKKHRRGVTLVFSGGPGFSTSLLNSAFLGPQRVETGPTVVFRADPQNLLNYSDFIFVDPPGTGYSTIEPIAHLAEAWSMPEDNYLLLGAAKKLLSGNAGPIFLVGESYGAVRAAAVLEGLSKDPVFAPRLRGLILFSPALTLGSKGATEDAKPPVVDSPTYRALQKHHKAETFSQNLEAEQFRSELLKDRGLILGRFDGRFTASVARNPSPYSDPSFDDIWASHQALLPKYLTQYLRVSDSLRYAVWAPQSAAVWKWRDGVDAVLPPVDLNTATQIGDVIRHNRKIRLFVATGTYDLAAPYADTKASLRRAGIGDEVSVFKVYPAGHFIYLDRNAEKSLSRDLRFFFKEQ